MTRVPIENNRRLQVRVTREAKARIVRAATIKQMDLTQFVIETTLREADTVIAQAESMLVSKRDFTRILELLEAPPAPNAKLRSAIAALPDDL